MASAGAPSVPEANVPLKMGTRLQLSTMMFLQYLTWGTWFVSLSAYLSANTGEAGKQIFPEGFVGRAYGTAAIAAMIAPFFVGMIADRFFATQHVLAVLHIVGAGILYYLSTVETPGLFYGVMLAYFLCFMPTLALTNSISFHHLPNPGRQFPGIRVLGTISWICAGQLTGAMGWGTSNTAMQVASGFSLLLGIYCFFLPHTPPKNVGHAVTARDVLGLDALALMKRVPFAIFVLGSFLVAIPLQFYYNYTNGFLTNIGVENATGKMTYGQMSEIFFMLLMPVFFARLGVKWMLLVGMLCWALRYVLFAFGNSTDGMWMLYIGILLHGICYDFFFVTGQIYVDNEADERIRGAAQGFIAFITLGIGGFIGAELSSYVDRMTVTTGAITHDWKTFWLIPAALAAGVMVLFAVAFHDSKSKAGT
ncbi:MAG: nucleoside permease [Planctomycetia bacterium]|nr:nucleoside permease [Planctomycetia bacterium]